MKHKHNSKYGNDWATPDWLLNEIKEEFGEFFDPCPYKHDLTKWNGLKIDWKIGRASCRERV